jgi:hypothetical protein
MADTPYHDPSDQVRGHLAAAIARLEPHSRGPGPLDEDAALAAITIAEHELGLALSALRHFKRAGAANEAHLPEQRR